MKNRERVLPILAAGLLVGCQSYSPVPLELEGYVQRLDARLSDVDRVAEFAAALSEQDVSERRFDLSDGLDCAEAEVLGLFYNPALRRARAEAGFARAGAEHAGLWKDPEFGFDAAQILSPGSQFDFGATLGLTLPISGRLGIERDSADAEYEAQLLRLADAEWNVRMDIRKAWASWVLARGRVEQYEQFSGQADELMETIDRLVEVGQLGRTEGRLVRIEQTVRLAEMADAELEEIAARSELLALIGLPADSQIQLSRQLPTRRENQVGDVGQRVIDSNTAVAVAVARYEVAEHALRYEVRKQFPDITLGGGFGSEGDDERLLFGVSLPIPVLNANRAGIAEAHAARNVARVDADIVLDRVLRDHALASARASAIRTQLELYEQSIAPMLDEQSAEISELAGLGEIRTLVLLETITRHMETNRRLLELLAEQSIWDTEITRLLGPDTERVGPLLIQDAATTAGGEQ